MTPAVPHTPTGRPSPMTASTNQPEPDLDPESVHKVYLKADIGPAIHAATQQQLRDILHHVCGHLCHQLGGMERFPSLRPDRRRAGEICQVGVAKMAGMQLFQQVIEAVAGSYLYALGFDPARATSDPGYFAGSIAPFLATARRQHLRRMLQYLTGHMDAVLSDSDKFAQAATETQTEVTGDLWEIAAGVGAAISLYRHCARVMSVHVRFYILDGLGIGNTPHYYRPYAPGPADTRLWSATLN